VTAAKIASEKVSGTADKVRVDRKAGTVHTIAKHWFERAAGHCYSTRCGTILTSTGDAIRTTYEADCPNCASGGARRG